MIEAAAILGGDEGMAQTIADLFEKDVRSQAITFTRAARSSDEKKAARIANLEIANARRAAQWHNTQERVMKIVLEMRAADPDVSLTELCVAINQASLPTYRPKVYPSWTPSMVGRFIRMKTRDAKPQTP